MDFRMRPSRALRKLRDGENVFLFKTNLTDPRVVEIAAAHGFDAIWAGVEHLANDWSVIERQVWAAKAYDVDLFCRVSRGSYSDHILPLELDCAGIIVPHVMSAEDARRVVQMTRFQPVGRRAADGGNADALYTNVPFAEYVEQANRERGIMLQVEDPEALEELDEIAAVDGFDILHFGAGDFSHAIGAPGQMDHPRIVEARQAVAEAARRHGKFAAANGSPDDLETMIAMGYQFLTLAADVTCISQHCREVAARCGITTSNQPVGYYSERA